MALTASRMLELGTELPPFALRGTESNLVGNADFARKPLLVAFICNHCPYVKPVKHELARLDRDPEFYLFDAQHRLVYRGQLDDSRPNSGKPVTGKDVREAVEALLGGRPVAQQQTPSIGCNIEWKAASS